jgi:SNF2 family DNA or RNA helicase
MKTLPHLKLIEHFLSNGGSRALVVSPKILVRSAWLNEIQERAEHLGAKVAIAEAPAANRKAAFDSDADIILMNVDGYQWLSEQPKRWLRNRIGAKSILVNDESHTLKNPTAKRTKAALMISEMFAKRHILSGTMAPNSITELWSQFKIVDGGARLGKRFHAFRNVMQRPIAKGAWVEWADKPDAADIVYGLVSDIMIRHPFAKVMKHVPPMQQRVIWYDLSPKHRKLYDQLEKDSYLEYGSKDITALNAGALANKLLQCASGAVYHDLSGEKKTWEVIDSGRYELITELVDARQQSIVFFLWHHQKTELERLLRAKRLSYEVLDGTVKSNEKRAETVRKFQNGELRTILMHPKTGAYGLTLTKGSSVIYASPVYEAAAKIQGDARLLRGMQDKETESIVLLGRDTRDQHAYEVFTGKLDRLTALNNLFAGGG